MATALVCVTFFSAPLMLVSAKMVALVRIDPADYVQELETFLRNVSSVAIVAGVRGQSFVHFLKFQIGLSWFSLFFLILYFFNISYMGVSQIKSKKFISQ